MDTHLTSALLIAEIQQTLDRYRDVDLAAPIEASAREVLDRPVKEMFSTRVVNSLEREGITSVGDLVTRTERDVLGFEALGQISLAEITRKLSRLGLRLGMSIPPPADQSKPEGRSRSARKAPKRTESLTA
jgi:DNA-directed RNA polymerase alpha subunit